MRTPHAVQSDTPRRIVTVAADADDVIAVAVGAGAVGV